MTSEPDANRPGSSTPRVEAENRRGRSANSGGQLPSADASACPVVGASRYGSVQRIRDELHPWADEAPGGRDDFVGHQTVRVGAVMTRSPSSHALALDPKLNEACKTFLPPTPTATSSTSPNSPASAPAKANSAFTIENGATRVVPGSHKWEPGRQPELHEIAYAEMEAGSVLVYTGSVIHGGGRNETDTNREGLLLHNTLNWLRQEPNQHLTCPPHIAQHFTPERRALLGYPSSYGLGFISTPFPPGEGAELEDAGGERDHGLPGMGQYTATAFATARACDHRS